MQNLDPSQQIEFIKRTGDSPKLIIGATVASIVFFVSISYFQNSTDQTVKVILFFLAAVSGILATAMATGYYRFRRAARAIRTGLRVSGMLQLEITEIDSENITFTGVLTSESGICRLKFAKPFGWEPQNGEWPCELIFLSGNKMPVLVKLNDGLLFPTKTIK